MKNLKNEYKDMMNSEMPDLWGKISSQLGDNSEGAPIPERIQSYIDEEQCEKAEKTIKTAIEHKGDKRVSENIRNIGKVSEKRKPRFLSIYRYGTLIAACICLVLLIPVMFSSRSKNKSADMASAVMNDEFTGQSSAEENEMMMADCEADYAMDYAEEPVENLAETSADYISETKDLYSFSSVSEEASDEEILDETMNKRFVIANPNTVDNVDLMKQIRVKVISVAEESGQMVYTVQVLKDYPDYDLKKDDLIEVTVMDSETSKSQNLNESCTMNDELTPDNIYELDLIPLNFK